MSTNSIWRPSNLPKLSKCVSYTPAPENEEGGVREAAARGTRIDNLFRLLLAGEPIPEKVDPGELAAAKIAAQIVRDQAKGSYVFSRDVDCKLSLEIDFEKILDGTCDAICPEINTLWDLKTGLDRDYEMQMCAYALASMQKYSQKAWTTILIFVDQGYTRTHTFSYEESESRIRKLWKDFQSPTPTLCEYCNWCLHGPKHKGDCKALQEIYFQFLGSPPAPKYLQDLKKLILSDEKLAGEFLFLTRTLDVLREEVERKVKESNDFLPTGWRVVTRKLPDKLRQDKDLREIIEKMSADEIIECANFSAKKLESILSSKGIDVQPFIESGGVTKFLTPVKKA